MRLLIVTGHDLSLVVPTFKRAKAHFVAKAARVKV